MNEQPPAPTAALDENAPEKKTWIRPEIQELDHELTAAATGPGADAVVKAYSSL